MPPAQTPTERRLAVVTGGTRGIGEAIARALARRRLARRRRRDRRGGDRRVRARSADRAGAARRDRRCLRRGADRALRPRIDALVNCAGILRKAQRIRDREFRRACSTSTSIGTMRMCVAARAEARRGEGRDRQHRLDVCLLRRAARAGLCGLEGRRRAAHEIARRRLGAGRHPRQRASRRAGSTRRWRAARCRTRCAPARSWRARRWGAGASRRMSRGVVLFLLSDAARFVTGDGAAGRRRLSRIVRPNEFAAERKRGFLAGAGAAGLRHRLLPAAPRRACGADRRRPPPQAPRMRRELNAFVRIAPDDTVTVALQAHRRWDRVRIPGLTTIVAEELDADWSQMRAAAAPANDELYKNLAFGVHGDRRLHRDRQQLRPAPHRPVRRRAPCLSPPRQPSGACRRARSRSSAAGFRHAASGNESGFGALAEKAATMALEGGRHAQETRKTFSLIGTDVPSPRHCRRNRTARRSSRSTSPLPGHADGACRAPDAVRREGGELRRQRQR